MNSRHIRLWLAAAIILFPLLALPKSQPHKTENIFLITVDGFRWQEVFGGGEELLMNPHNGGVQDTNRLRTAFLRGTPEDRRKALLPFFWSEIAGKGQIFGNKNK